jgi:tRNA threonylcarbamoyladenosine biosynthesis protein TsaB
VSLSCGDDLPLFRHEPVSAGASQLLLPWIETFLREADISLQDLDAIAIGVGPGAFTGVRLGLAVTQGLAISAALPVLPIASLDAIAAQLVQSSHYKSSDAKTFAVLIDARMDEVYWAKYHVSSQGLPNRIGEIVLSKPEKIDLSDVQFIAGSAVSEYGERLLIPQSMSFSEKYIDKTIGVSALGILDCAQVHWAQGKQIQVSALEPLYIRNKVALTTEERMALYQVEALK